VKPVDRDDWVASKIYVSGLGFVKGDANPLCHALGCYSGSSQNWVDWSESHPKLAAVFWSQIFDWLREDRHGGNGQGWSKAYSLLRNVSVDQNQSDADVTEWIRDSIEVE
jgi:hypothetical protein